MTFIVIYSDMVGVTQALPVTADSWSQAREGLFKRLRDAQDASEDVDRSSLMMIPTMIIKADNPEIKRITSYISNEGEEVCDYTENFMPEVESDDS
jgi:hypothetical protein